MGKKNLTISAAVLDAIMEPKEEKPFHITQASIVDDFCHYTVEHLHGIQRGELSGNKKRLMIIDKDMRTAFKKFAVHMAVIMDIFKHAGQETDSLDIDKLHGHEIAWLFDVSGFEIQGKEENEGIVLVGTYSTAFGRVPIKTPKVMLDKSSSYKFYNELKVAADDARYEVEEYRAGRKGELIPEDDKKPEKENPKQTKLYGEVKVVVNTPDGQPSDEFANAEV
jgi:hypothetical protein